MAKFNDHLEDLYEVFGPDMTKVPTPQEILDGVAKSDDSLTFDVKFKLAVGMIDQLSVLWTSHGKKSNILIDAKLNRFLAFLSLLGPEMAIYFLRQISELGIDSSEKDVVKFANNLNKAFDIS